jgi:hypothetical protein
MNASPVSFICCGIGKINVLPVADIVFEQVITAPKRSNLTANFRKLNLLIIYFRFF